MELLEYQAKELFRIVGIPVLPSQTIQDSRQIKQLQIPYPVVLKSQVSSGGRGKAGGVRFVANTIDAIAAARSIFNLSILGEYPEVILAEAHYNIKRELFLAIVLDYDLQCPVLLGSAYGGMNVNSLLSNLEQVVVDAEFSLFYARKLAASMGLSGTLICSVSKIMAKMYRLFQETDLDLIEINPLGVNNYGELMALDGKITINDHALTRQPIIETLNFSQQQIKNINHDSWQRNKDFSHISWRWLNWHESTGKVVMICSSFDAALLTWDLLKQNEVIPARSALLENSLNEENSNLELYQAQLQEILTEIELMTNIEAVVVNIWESEAISRKIVDTIIAYCYPITEQPAPVNEAIALNSEKSASTQAQASYFEGLSKPYFGLRLLNQDHLGDLPETEQIFLSSDLEQVIKSVKLSIT